MGAEVTPEGVHFRVWAPVRQRVEVVFEEDSAGEWAVDVELAPEADGYFSGLVPGAGAGALYQYRLDGGDAFPDPASRFQPEGPHGPSAGGRSRRRSAGPTAAGRASAPRGR